MEKTQGLSAIEYHRFYFPSYRYHHLLELRNLQVACLKQYKIWISANIGLAGVSQVDRSAFHNYLADVVVS